jgi:hypothetical protein
VLIGLVLAAVLALPYLRFSFNNPNAAAEHLHQLWSYWFEKIPLSAKIGRYISEFGVGLSPWYWYIPNDRDLPRHLMKNYGHIMLATLPLALLGLAHTLRNLRFPACRAVLIALLISPAASALVQTSITRTLVFVVPVAILTAIGLEKVLGWIEDPKKRLFELAEDARPNPRRMIAALIILVTGILLAATVKESINGLALWALAILLALQVSGVLQRLARSLTRADSPQGPKLWRLPSTFLALSAFLVLAGANIRMLNDALRNGPLWFRDYGLGGMQYGDFQIFDIVDQYVKEHPGTRVIFSPDWTNGADVLTRFFLGDSPSVKVGSVQGHITQKLPLDDSTLFVMTPQEYNLLMGSGKFSDVDVETIFPYPDGNPGFYFVRLRYVANIDEIFAAERAARQALQEATLRIDGQNVKLRFSYLDAEFQDKWIALAFDNDPFTVVKTFDTNPFIIEMTFPGPRTLTGFSIIIGSTNVKIMLKCYSRPDAQPAVYTFEGQGTKDQPELSFELSKPTQAQVLRVEVLDVHASDQSKVHIWELKLR